MSRERDLLERIHKEIMLPADIEEQIDVALAESEAEPICWVSKSKINNTVEITAPNEKSTNPKFWTDSFPVWNKPPHQEPVYLSVDEIAKLGIAYGTGVDYAKAIEQAVLKANRLFP